MSRRGGTEKIGDVIAGLLQRRGYARPLALAGYREAWSRAAGPRLAERSRVAAYRNGTLTIEVTSSAQRYELEAFHGRQLLIALQQDTSITTVRKLVFRVGSPAS